MDKALLNILCENGFSEKEAQVYITNLQLGQAPVSSIARHMHENRVTIYSILKSLANKGIVNSSTKKNTTYYSVVQPELLVKRMTQKVDRLQQAVPELLALTSKMNTPVKTQFFEWIEGLKTMYHDILDTGTDIKAFLWAQAVDEEFKSYLNTYYLPKRISKKIFAQVILPDNALTRAYAKEDKKWYRKTVMISKDIFNLQSEVNIYGGNKVCIAMFSSAELSGICIESKDLHDTLSGIFDTLRAMSGWTKQ